MAIHSALEKAFSDRRFKLLFSFVIAFVLAAAVTIDQQSKNFIKLLAVAGLLVTLLNWREIKRHAGEFHLGSVVALLLYFFAILLAITANPINQDTFHDLRIMSIGFTSIFIWGLLISIRFRADFFWWGILLCAISSGGYALVEVYHYGIDHRAVGSSNKWVMFGDIALISGLLSMAAINHFKHKSTLWKWLPYFAAGMGLIASFLSGTRGGWIYLPLAGIIFLIHHSRQRQLRSLFNLKHLTLLVLILGVVGIAVFSYTKVPERISIAYQEIHGYMTDRSASTGRTSIGQRFEMWRAVFIVAQEKPLFGLGPGGFKQHLQALADADVVNQIIANAIPGGQGHTPHSHAHNEYFNTLATRGLVGLITLMGVFLLPLLHFFAVAKSPDPLQSDIGLAGIILVTGYMVFALSESVLYHQITGNFYFLALVSLLFLANRQAGDAAPG
jgi:O-antigen ligase